MISRLLGERVSRRALTVARSSTVESDEAERGSAVISEKVVPGLPSGVSSQRTFLPESRNRPESTAVGSPRSAEGASVERSRRARAGSASRLRRAERTRADVLRRSAAADEERYLEDSPATWLRAP